MDLTEKTFGPDISLLKGKPTRKQLILIFSNAIDIPTELLRVNKEVEVSQNDLQVNEL